MITWRARATGRCRPASSRSPTTTPTISSARCRPSSASRRRCRADAFTAQALGTERAGNGVADPRRRPRAHHRLPRSPRRESVWLSPATAASCRPMSSPTTRRRASASCRRWRGSTCRRWRSAARSARRLGERVVVAGAGGRQRSVAARIVAKQEFAGYWEYVLDEAIFTAPAHPHWGGTALIGPAGDLLGIGSLQLAAGAARAAARPAQHGRADRPAEADPRRSADARPAEPPAAALARAFATEADDKVMVVGLADGGPAERAGLKVGDAMLAVRGDRVRTSPAFSARSGRSATPASRSRYDPPRRRSTVIASPPATATAS